MHRIFPPRGRRRCRRQRNHRQIDDFTIFTARLDGLRTDQDPDDLSNALRAAFKEPELYDWYISSLEEDTERAKALLEVFDKVRSVKCAAPWIGSQC